MFRGGSTGTGVTSGLAPRQGYANENSWEQLVKQLPEIQKVSQEYGYKPRGTNVWDFLTEFGLDIASRPPSGNIISTAAASAKEPYQRFLTRKGEADVQKYASESDMFKTLVGAQAKILTGAAESGAGVKEGYSEEIKKGLDQIWALKDQLDDKTITQEDYDKKRNRIIQGLGPYMKDSPELERLFEVPDYAEDTYDEHKAKFLTEELMDDPRYPGEKITKRAWYSLPENKAELRRLATDSYMKEFQERRLGLSQNAEGGRIGYYAG